MLLCVCVEGRSIWVIQVAFRGTSATQTKGETLKGTGPDSCEAPWVVLLEPFRVFTRWDSPDMEMGTTQRRGRMMEAGYPRGKKF